MTSRRKILVARCYGNPIPRRSGREGIGDPSCFAYVRHNFMRAGMEIVDCPHLTSQFKNSSDIRIACDVRDYIDHQTRFDEFIILSGDADFTPVLLSLRSHARQTVIYANDYTSPYYKAFSDARIQEDDLIRCLLQPEAAIAEDQMPAIEQQQRTHALERPQQQRVTALERQHVQAALEAPRAAVPIPEQPCIPASIQEPQPTTLQSVSPRPVPAAPAVEAARVQRRPVPGSDAAIQSLIEDFKVIGNEILTLVLDVVDNSEKPVPLAYLADRAQKALGHPKTIGTNWAGSGGFLNFLTQNLPETLRLSEKPPHFVYNPAKHRLREETTVSAPQFEPQNVSAANTVRQREQQQAAGGNGRLADLQRSITRIYEACQAPPLPPSEYQLLFTLIASEVRDNGFAPDRSANAVVKRAEEAGLKLFAKDVNFVIEAVDEIDPWLEHTRSSTAVARAYRDYVLARCQQAGVSLSEDEKQLVQVWFGASQWTQNPATGEQKTETPNASLEATRRYSPPEHTLSAPTAHPDDFAYPEVEEPEQKPQPRAGALRYSFLKHG